MRVLRYWFTLLLLKLGRKQCESHNHTWSRWNSDEAESPLWVCPRCCKVMCWTCEGGHANDPETDPVCDDCWQVITVARIAKKNGFNVEIPSDS